MADFEGTAALSQPVSSVSASGDTVNPGGTQMVGVCIAIGNVINSGSASVTQAVSSVSASGSAYDFAGSSAITQSAGSLSASGSTGPAIQAAIVQSGQWVSASGAVVSSGSVSPATLTAQQAVVTRRDIQLPRIPTSVPKDAQDWFTAAQKIIEKYIFGSDGSRLVSINDLTKAGIADRDGSSVRPPSGNLTTPTKVADMRADGALASIIITWKNPVFPNYSHTELWRASVDDVGQAVKIQETAVESYVDMVGSGSVKFYWARAVSTAGVRGDFNAQAGTRGETGYDPGYVRDLMTSSSWKAVTPYGAYQYVRPTTPNGYQYACLVGGRTGGDEPAWPTTVGDTISDGSATWQCVAADARVPFVIGTDPNGNPAVYMDTAYIEEASITSAKIGDLVADKITTGDLNADLHVLSKLWYGFSDYANPGNESGFWIGALGSMPATPAMKFTTGGVTPKEFSFDGSAITLRNVQIVSGDDCSFDDMTADSARLTRAQIDFLAVPEFVVASDYTTEQGIGIDDPNFEQYLCFPGGCRKTEEWTSQTLLMGNGSGRHYAYFQTGIYSSIIPYNIADNSTRYRARSKAIGLTLRLTAPSIGKYDVSGYRNYLVVYILDEYQTLANGMSYSDVSASSGLPSTYLGKIVIPYIDAAADEELPVLQNTGSGDVQVCTATFDTGRVYQGVKVAGILGATIQQVIASSLILRISSDEEAFGYSGGRRIKFAAVYKADPWIGTKDDYDVYGTIKIEAQIISDIAQSVADNDPII